MFKLQTQFFICVTDFWSTFMWEMSTQYLFWSLSDAQDHF